MIRGQKNSMEQKDYYQILGVQQDADAGQMKEAYRQLALKYHPDRNKGNPEATEAMKNINEAYAVLSNPKNKRAYDTMRQQFGSSAYNRFRQAYTEQDIFHGSDIFHIFEEMTRSFGFRNPDEIFREFYGKGYRRFEFKRPGVFAGGFVFFGGPEKSGRHHRSFPARGSLAKLSRFVLNRITGIDMPEEGTDINDVIHLTPRQALEGGPYAYYLRQKEKKLVVHIPKNIRHGQRIRLSGQGREGKGGGTPGDLYLKVEIKKPLLQKIKDFTADLIK